MLTERQVRKIHKAGVEFRFPKRKQAGHQGLFVWHEDNDKKIIYVFPGCCTESCTYTTLLHELIHARDFLNGGIIFLKKRFTKAEKAEFQAQEEAVDREAMLTCALHPEIFEVIRELWGITFVEIKKKRKKR